MCTHILIFIHSNILLQITHGCHIYLTADYYRGIVQLIELSFQYFQELNLGHIIKNEKLIYTTYMSSSLIYITTSEINNN